jgi:hypothetical protein
MLNYKIFGAALLVSAAIGTPALAGSIQVAEAIQEPGAYAFYHPNADLGLGSSSRPSNALAETRGDVAGMRMSVRTPHARRTSTSKHD